MDGHGEAPSSAGRRRVGRRDAVGGGFGAIVLAVAAVLWSNAERYRNAFMLKRAAAPLKYDDHVIVVLRHGHTMATLLVAGVVVLATLRIVVHLRRRRRSTSPPGPGCFPPSPGAV